MARTYVVSSATYVPGPADPLVTIVGTVDGAAVTVTVWLSAMQQAKQLGGIQAVKNLIAPLMLAALPPPPPAASVELPTGTFTQ
jgi:hypothetical protein